MDRRVPALVAATVAGVAGLAVRSLWVEVRRTIVRRRTLTPTVWPAELDGLRVALVGDVHGGARHVTPARVARIADALARARPDLLLLAGDVMDSQAQVPPGPFADALARVPGPRVAVLGNHDFEYGGARVEAALRDAQFAVLEDEPLLLRMRGGPLWIAGIEDDYSGAPDPQAVLRAIPEGEPILGLTHSPDVFPRIPARVALTVAGHTHGGQVAIPWLRGPWTPSRHGERFVAGHVVEDGRHLYVTRGVGTSRHPVRLFAPSEVVLLTLRSPAAGR